MFCFFFFQAEDGIRDGTVTGVQTCALPISRRIAHSLKGASANLGADSLAETAAKAEAAIESKQAVAPALEELSQSLNATIAAILAAVPAESPAEIGRASCRERVWITVGGGA